MRCNICDKSMGEPLYVSAHEKSITSLGVVIPQKTAVFFSKECSHFQTEPLEELERYYDEDYQLLVRSEDEDQLYQYLDGKKVFRFDHQADTLLRVVELPHGALALDYGCSKAATLKRLVERRPDVVPHAFDITNRYVSFWERFVHKDNWSIYDIKSSWGNRFDLVSAFFVLEHVADPRKIVREVKGLLKSGGTFYAIVPNTYANPADFLVADHINHFSPRSLRRLLTEEGFAVERIDDSLHEGAFVTIAKKNGAHPTIPDEAGDPDYTRRASYLADFWRVSSEKIKKFEQEHKDSHSAIYGAGFYGTFIAGSLEDFGKISCFVDQNPYLQGGTHLGKPVFAPDSVPADIDTIYVGLNPAVARGELEKIHSWKGKHYNYFLYDVLR